MRVGPLRFLAVAATAVAVWVASRVPVVLSGAARDVAAGAGVAVAAVETANIAANLAIEASPPPAAIPATAGTHHGPPSARGEDTLVRMAVATREPRAVMSPGLRRDDEKANAVAATSALTPLAPPGGAQAVAAPLASSPTTIASMSDAPTRLAFDLATAAYAAALRGDRRVAARDFTAALASEPEAANAPQWRAALRALTRRWSGEAYVLVRGGGDPGLGVAPLLGGGQSGAALAWTPDPLARRPLAVVARATVAHRGAGVTVDGGSAQAALGVRWQVLPQASLTAERLIAVGDGARDAWTLRAAGGVARRAGPLLADAYAEAGIVGARRRDMFASVQARAVVPITARRIAIEPGVGLWSSVQRADTRLGRVDLGPTFTARAGPVAATLDYRIRVAGDAAPGNGPALTLSARF